MGGLAPPDNAARITAVTDIERSYLVEAGAGSGKTSIIAGRVAVLLARGIEPKSIAAITFTEFAASELRIRIETFVNDLADGIQPSDLKHTLPGGLTPEQRSNLESARGILDQLVCTTIHGFAQTLIKPYPAEAGIDPGAEIIDPAEADLSFDELYQAWVRRRLSGDGEDDVIAELVLGEETPGLGLIRSVADFLRHNRAAKPAPCYWSVETGAQFLAAVAAFEREFEGFEFGEEQTDAMRRAFGELAKALRSVADGTKPPNSRSLVEAACLPRDKACFNQDGEKRLLRRQGAWQDAAAAAGKRRADGTAAFVACRQRYDACHETFRAFIAMVAGVLLGRVAEALAGLLSDWNEYKRATALLDFDDLLFTAKELLIKNEGVRLELSKRFQYVLVDEFQDTDPLQIEILWRLCAERPGNEDARPLSRRPRAGALFLVGDPKQAVYRFRGADVNAYIDAREAMGSQCVLEIVANFRSVEPIVSFVNEKFSQPLSSANGQPGFTQLAATLDRPKDQLTVAALDVRVDEESPSAAARRDAEANRITELCRRLVGNFEVRDRGTKRPCRYGDIALLAPVGTELWRFEEALEQGGIPVSTQAGKGFFRRQEIQDLIAVTRAIADARDTLALGSLLRGPLVGLSEAELLDISEGLPGDILHSERLCHLSLWTEPEHINHALARNVLEILQSLAKQALTTTPYMLLSEAVNLLDVRANQRQRFSASADRALANIDLFLETARSYDVRGLRAFAQDMRSNWEEEARQVEGRPDAEEHSVSLITIHVSKGLEWPVVIPINMTGDPSPETGLVHDRKSGLFSIPVLGIEPADYAAMRSQSEAEFAREHVRLWYVAATRARDLLVLPRHIPEVSEKSWARLINMNVDALPAIEPVDLGSEVSPPATLPENCQTQSLFVEEASRILDAELNIQWKRPSLHEADALPSEPIVVFSDPETAEAEEAIIKVTGSAARGTVLHKLMEEVLTGETKDSHEELKRRATDLLAQLGLQPASDSSLGIAPNELAATVVRTLMLPEIVALRPYLLPEQTVFGRRSAEQTEVLMSGIADAIARDSTGKVLAVIDWKSDVRISIEKLAAYGAQIADYGIQTGAERALLVLMTSGKIISTGASAP